MNEGTIDFDSISDAENESRSDVKNVGRKRYYHNILERNRRNHIKDGFMRLRDAVPSICGRKMSRIQILKRAIEYIVKEEEDIQRREHHLQKMKKRAEFLKKVVDFMKKKDFGLQKDP